MGESVEPKKKRLTMLKALLLLSLGPMLVVAIVLTLFGWMELSTALEEDVYHELIVAAENLKSHYEIQMAETQDHQPVYDHTYIDGIKDNDIEQTLFMENVRFLTSVEAADNESGRNEGTTASEEIWKIVSSGETYTERNVPVNGEEYYVAYVPVNGVDGSVVGMAFAGKKEELVKAQILALVSKLVGASILMAVICSVIVIIVAKRIQEPLQIISVNLELLSEGQLKAKKTAKSSIAEIDSIIKSRLKLSNNLREIIGQVQEASQLLLQGGNELQSAAENTSVNADDISRAIEEVSRGSVEMASDIDKASLSVSDMGDKIEGIVTGITDLDHVAGDMDMAGQKALQIIKELDASNERTVEAIRVVAENVEATDRSVAQITTAVGLITEIAEQTNLLSLNASIEAARAGEVGRGFAVVANEISGLAAQSNDSAKKIEEFLAELVADSRRSITKMEEVGVLLREQQEKLRNTEKEFANVESGIQDTKNQSDTVDGQAKDCDRSRVQVIDIIASLSSISQQNAASTQETTASMQELNATINLVAHQAEQVREQAASLEQAMKFFRYGDS